MKGKGILIVIGIIIFLAETGRLGSIHLPPPPAAGGGGAQPAPVNGHYQPSWASSGSLPVLLDDEFNGTSVGSPWVTNWFGGNGPVNRAECSSYNPSLVSESGGYLHLGAYSIVSSNPAFQFTHGSVEWRAYLPPDGGEIANWPALWLDGQHWPADGEFDVVEGLHGSAMWHIPTDGNPGGQEGGGPGWHLFGVSWSTSGTVTFYHDSQQVGQVNNVPNNQPMYLIMGNQCGSSTQVAGTTVLIDWVRVWGP